MKKKTLLLLLCICIVLFAIWGISRYSVSAKKELINTLYYGSEQEIEKIFGTEWEHPYARDWCRIYKNADLFGKKGILEVNYFYNSYSSGNRNSVSWIYEKSTESVEQYEKIAKKYIKLFDDLYGENIRYGNGNQYKWNTISGRRIELCVFDDYIDITFM